MAGTLRDHILNEVDSLTEEELNRLQEAIRQIVSQREASDKPSWWELRGKASPGERDAAEWFRKLRDESERKFGESA